MEKTLRVRLNAANSITVKRLCEIEDRTPPNVVNRLISEATGDRPVAAPTKKELARASDIRRTNARG